MKQPGLIYRVRKKKGSCFVIAFFCSLRAKGYFAPVFNQQVLFTVGIQVW